MPPKRTSYSKYPFKNMAVGDSFLFDGDRDVVGAAGRYFAKGTNIKFSIRKADGGYRVWRVA